MRMFGVANFARLTRLDTSILTACIVFAPYVLRGERIVIAAQKALPILLTCMCCFVLNDIYDLEKDRINHPHRPLPIGAISERGAMGIYFVLLTGTLLSIFAYISQEQYYIYLLCLIVFTNYNHVVSDFPLIKNFYVATASALPILILRPSIFEVTIVDVVALAMMLFILGREILMDVQDLTGDGKTLARNLGARLSVKLGFSSQIVAMFILAFNARGLMQWIATIFLFFSALVAISLWQREKMRVATIHGMKVQAIAGLAFLF